MEGERTSGMVRAAVDMQWRSYEENQGRARLKKTKFFVLNYTTSLNISDHLNLLLLWLVTNHRINTYIPSVIRSDSTFFFYTEVPITKIQCLKLKTNSGNRVKSNPNPCYQIRILPTTDLGKK
jgi:hypothetical protein